MEEKRKMTRNHITSSLRNYLIKHKDEFNYATTKFTGKDVMNFIVCVQDKYLGKDYYDFSGKIEIKDPQKDGITDWLPTRGRVYIEEGENNEPKFSKVDLIYLL